jgi:DeoR/GlpR family transcriptional regulator of sugar metabolism
VWNHHALVISAQRKMIAAAERTIFALDDSKFGRKALSLTAPFGPGMTVVTNTRPAPAVEKVIAAAGSTLKFAQK